MRAVLMFQVWLFHIQKYKRTFQDQSFQTSKELKSSVCFYVTYTLLHKPSFIKPRWKEQVYKPVLNGRSFELPGPQTCSLCSDLYLVELRKRINGGEKEGTLKRVCVCFMYYHRKEVLRGIRRFRRKKLGELWSGNHFTWLWQKKEKKNHVVSVNTLKTLEQYGAREST